MTFAQLEACVRHVHRCLDFDRSDSSCEDRVFAIENRLQEVHDNNYILIHAVDDLERAMKILHLFTSRQTYSFPCTVCGVIFCDEPTWNAHVKNED